MLYLAAFITALLLALVVTPLVRTLALRLRIVDHPGQRKIHQKPTPLLGGLAVYVAFGISTILFWSLGFISDTRITNVHSIAILLGGLILIVGGILDDRFSLKPTQQIWFPILAISLVLAAGVRVQVITNPLGGLIEFPMILGTTFAFFWLLGMVYTTKFLDGLDGLVAGVATIGSLVIFGVSLYWDVPLSGTSLLALMVAGATSGFLVFNWHPAKIFLGEGGSVWCGFMLGVLSIISGSKIATALLIMGIPILDVLWVIARRLFEGRSPVHGDDKHLHFRLLDIGLSHRQAVSFLYLMTATFGLTSIFLPSKGKLMALGVLSLVMVILAIILVVAYKIKHETANKK